MTDKLRKEDWLQQLNSVVEQSKDRPFVWGEWDCALWAAEAVNAMTGIDFAEEFRGKYDDEMSAALALREMGSGSLYNVLRGHLGNPVHKAKAWRGDIAYYRKSLGICYGQIALFVGSEVFLEEGQPFEGLVSIPMSEIKTIFKVR